jgi:hypothetical protein
MQVTRELKQAVSRIESWLVSLQLPPGFSTVCRDRLLLREGLDRLRRASDAFAVLAYPTLLLDIIGWAKQIANANIICRTFQRPADDCADGRRPAVRLPNPLDSFFTRTPVTLID